MLFFPVARRLAYYAHYEMWLADHSPEKHTGLLTDPFLCEMVSEDLWEGGSVLEMYQRIYIFASHSEV
jgi:hypothetical protein